MGNNSHLTVYKASAGSGKTFRLAVQYITMLIKEPEDYRHILAVTFTNKAAFSIIRISAMEREEMQYEQHDKQRDL